jgi:TonB family protein
MRIHHRGILAAISGLLAATGASAQPQCDCTSIVGSCTATAQLQDSLIEITSSVQQCSRVDYLVDGIPFVSLVVDGAAQRSAIVQGTPAVIVQGCQVCREDLATAAATSTGSGSGLVSEGEPMRLISVDPVYPAEAAAAGLEGWVDVSFAVSAFGTVTAPAVVAAEPAGVFDAAALAAVSRWRYTRPPPGEERQVTERVRFELSDALCFGAPDRAGFQVTYSSSGWQVFWRTLSCARPMVYCVCRSIYRSQRCRPEVRSAQSIGFGHVE